MGDLTKNFSRWEFACKCGCGFDDIDMRAVNLAQEIRTRLGRSLSVNSGCRCPDHNRKVGGKRRSAHLKGLAVDLPFSNMKDRHLALKSAFSLVVPRLGIYKTFIHLDYDYGLPPGVWESSDRPYGRSPSSFYHG